jgi:dimethylhistidine N-methyltransferase
MENFLIDVLTGLRSSPKYLNSKYFYDKKGDELFQALMNSEDYYLTNCEMEIFKEQNKQMADSILKSHSPYDVIEFGPGDAVKSIHLLKQLVAQKGIGNYFPIDISENIIGYLEKELPKMELLLHTKGLNGEYLKMLTEAKKISANPKVILFLGGNVGNFTPIQLTPFLKNLRGNLSGDDQVLIGFDLKKNPKKILKAYNDKQGITRAFNLNLLERINRELGGDFNADQFDHFPTYDPVSGACKSYLISLKDQEVSVNNNIISFKRNEPIFMEISQKYSLEEISTIATECGFKSVATFIDSGNNFADVLWKV